MQVSGTTIDLGARPDGIMPQGIKLLAFGVYSPDAQTFYNGEFDPGSG